MISTQRFGGNRVFLVMKVVEKQKERICVRSSPPRLAVSICSANKVVCNVKLPSANISSNGAEVNRTDAPRQDAVHSGVATHAHCFVLPKIKSDNDVK